MRMSSSRSSYGSSSSLKCNGGDSSRFLLLFMGRIPSSLSGKETNQKRSQKQKGKGKKEKTLAAWFANRLHTSISIHILHNFLKTLRLDGQGEIVSKSKLNEWFSSISVKIRCWYDSYGRLSTWGLTRGFKQALALMYSLIRFFPLQKYSSTTSFRPSWHNNCSEKAELNSGQLKHG